MPIVINNTPHAIVIYSENSATFHEKSRKWILTDGQSPIATIAPSDTMLNIRFEDEQIGKTEIGGMQIPLMKRTVFWVDKFPDDDNYHIVSALYANALGEENGGRCLTVGTPVYIGVDKPQPCGIISLKRGA